MRYIRCGSVERCYKFMHARPLCFVCVCVCVCAALVFWLAMRELKGGNTAAPGTTAGAALELGRRNRCGARTVLSLIFFPQKRTAIVQLSYMMYFTFCIYLEAPCTCVHITSESWERFNPNVLYLCTVAGSGLTC